MKNIFNISFTQKLYNKYKILNIKNDRLSRKYSKKII